MKSTIYTIKDTYSGIELTIEGELTDWEDNTPPDIIINDIYYDNNPISLWTLSDNYIKHLKDRIFKTWCLESGVNHA